MTLSEIIKEYKLKTGYSDEYIANHLGVSRSTVTRWASGDTKKVQPLVIQQLSELMGVDIDELMTNSLFKHQKPVIGVVKAGYDLFAEENYLGYEEVTEDENRKGDYFLQVSGDSMIGAKIHDGDLVYVKSTDDIESHDIGVVLIGREEVTIKRVVKKSNMLILEAANPNYENRYFSNEEVEMLPVQVIGKVMYSKTVF